jgi:regulator of protease activity HflC (stomatin/prohibitin superfamily)
MEWWHLALGLTVIVAIVVVIKLLPRPVTVHDYERGILFARGHLKQVVGAGMHWVMPYFRRLEVVDMRSRVVGIAGQEVLSSDNVSVRVSVAIRFRVAAAELMLKEAQLPEAVLYLEAQLILRDLVAALPIEELLQKREQLSGQLQARLEPKAAALGLSLETVGIKDVMFPGGLKQIFAQVVEAKKSAQAALEKARGETATLRHLANAAKLLEGNPALVTLKTLQAASDGKHTLVLGVSQPIIPVAKEVDGSGAKPPLPGGEKTIREEGD